MGLKPIAIIDIKMCHCDPLISGEAIAHFTGRRCIVRDCHTAFAMTNFSNSYPQTCCSIRYTDHPHSDI